ncbi:MAG: NADP-dependent oxidoreductase [Gammaproteobacteria bacterium]|nr:NADP-dependent oxidoreductase [Gammaproteobacteria bacterium]MYB37372.1 NADP-dependent oxidoreductase [Gammaproteobacteria bacterium]
MTESGENRRVVVVRRPQGLPVSDDFALQPAPVPGPGVAADVLYISIDPYLRGRLSGRHVTGPIAPGAAMDSELVVRTREDSAVGPAGTLARGFGPWQERVAVPEQALTRLPDGLEPESLAIGVVGMPGLTAYAGVHRILHPAAGETVVVSAAAGPVGATAGQLCKAAGARAVGIAGSAQKRAWLVEEAGFDACIDRRGSVRAGLDATCPNGVDMYFDNVGGSVLQAVMERLAPNARVALCGLMDQYNDDEPPPGPNPALVIRARATLRGLVVYDHEDLRADMERDLGARVRRGTLAFREEVFEGIERAPLAFCRLMAGETFGKTVVRLR